MAPLIIGNDAIQGEVPPRTDLPIRRLRTTGQLACHLEQIDCYAPGHQARFGSLNYIADIRGDLIFKGFEPAAIAPPHLDERDLNLSSDHT